MPFSLLIESGLVSISVYTDLCLVYRRPGASVTYSGGPGCCGLADLPFIHFFLLRYEASHNFFPASHFLLCIVVGKFWGIVTKNYPTVTKET